MDAGERLRQALESIADHPRRVAASAMGVFWGAAAVVVMLAWGGGFSDYFAVEFGKYGRPSLFVIPGVTSSGFPGYRPGVPVRFDRTDVAAVERESSEWVEAILAEHLSEERLLVEARGRVRRLDLTGSDHRFPHYRRFDMAHGRFFAQGEVEPDQPVAVLGYDAALDLFGDPEQAIGRTLRVSGQAFELIGVFARKPGRQYMNTNRPDNRMLVVPASTAEARLGMDEDRISWINVFVRPGAPTAEVLRTVTASLARRANFHPDDADALRSFDIATILGTIELMDVAMTLFIGVAGTVTLLVGGIGIANYQLSTLEERANEIGVAKALGARDRTLMTQAIVESLLVSVSAGVLGVALGVGLSVGAAAVIPPGLLPAPELAPSVALIALVALVGVSTISAVVPALRVRRMDVSAALREGA